MSFEEDGIFSSFLLSYMQRSLSISTQSAICRAQEIDALLKRQFAYLIFYPEMADTEIFQARQFCAHLTAVKGYAAAAAVGDVLPEEIENCYSSIPDFEESEFEFGIAGIPSFLFYLVLPTVLITWLYRYIKLNTVRNKLGAAISRMHTAVFYLRAYGNGGN